ncbi:uncharacterized protein LOC144429919 [Styela clava]
MAERIFSDDLKYLPDFSFDDVTEYAEKHAGNGNSTKRGYKYFWESFIHDYKVFQDGQKFLIKARCYRSQRKNEPPHSLFVTLRRNNVLSATCSCTVGEAICCHSLALLYCTAHFSNLQLKKVPPAITGTMQLQSWHHPRSEGFKQLPIQKIIIQNPCSKSIRTIRSTLHKPGRIPQWQSFLNFSQYNIQLNTILPSNPSSVVSISTNFGQAPFGSPLAYQQICDEKSFEFPSLPLSSLSPQTNTVLTEMQHKVMQNLTLGREDCKHIEFMTRNQYNSPIWHQQRKFRITASKFGRIYKRVSNFDSLASNLTSSKLFQTAAMKRGIQMEPEAVKLYEEIKKCQCSPCGLVISSTCPWLGCSPDRKVYDPSCDGNLCYGLLEVKCPISDTFDKVSCLFKNDKGEWTLKMNHDYYFQIMGCLGITGLKWCDIIILLPSGACFIDRIHFDDAYFLDLQMRLESFFYDHFINTIATNMSS